MSLLTNRKDPPPKNATMTTKNPVYYKAQDRTDKDEEMQKFNLVPEVDKKGNRTGAYVKYKNDTPIQESISAPKKETPLTNKPKPIYKRAQDTTTGQYQIGEYVWDNVGKKWAAQYFSDEQQKKNYDAVRINYTGKKTSEGRAELDTPTYRSSKPDSTDSYTISNSFQGQKGNSKLSNRNK